MHRETKLSQVLQPFISTLCKLISFKVCYFPN